MDAMDVDYLVVGGGASALAFVDSMVTETDATFAIVDRRHVPGGHWNDAYPFVRLHQPSAFYGVASRDLGRDRKDTAGLNRGYYELASGVEVTAYFHAVMDEVLLPSGRVHYLPSAEYRPQDGGAVVSLFSGRTIDVRWRTVVDATVLGISIPLTHRRGFDVADGVVCEPPNHLPRLATEHGSIVILGGGKTGIDCVTWLLGSGYPPERITWVIPRDSWLINRATIQPGMEFFEASVGGAAVQNEICAEASTLEELCLRHETEGIWFRPDPDVWPEMFHSATISEHELAEMRRIARIVRMGRVSAIEPGRMVLAGGEIATEPDALHVDCTASAAAANVNHRAPIFADDTIRLQMIRPFQPCFSAALLGRIEATVADEAKPGMTRPTPMTDTVADWLTVQADGLLNAGAWIAEPAVSRWLGRCRLNALAEQIRNIGPEDGPERALFERLLAAVPGAVTNLQRLAAEVDATSSEQTEAAASTA